jgi:hypothetical protein
MRKLLIGALALIASTAAAGATTVTGTYSVTSSRGSTDIDKDLASPFTLNLALNTPQTFDLADLTEFSDGHADLTAIFNFSSSGGSTVTITGDDNYSTPGSSAHDDLIWDNGGFAVATFSNGIILDITLDGDSYNGAARNYNGVTPTVTFKMVHDDPPGDVPEPMTLSLFGAGLAGVAFAAARRRKATRS